MIDLENVKAQADLLAIIGHGTELKKVASSEGGEYAGPCPFCGGRDRFHVQPEARRWLCRHCTDGKWADVIDYIGIRDGLDPKNPKDFQEICKRASGGELPTTHIRRNIPTRQAYQAPCIDWQAAAAEVIHKCESALWDPKNIQILEYLHGRGLQDKTIKAFRLGYNPESRKIAGKYWLDQGIVIPCVVRGVIWYVKVRRLRGLDSKYRCMTGSSPAAIFNADWLPGLDIALFYEGEFDCMIAHQELNDVLPCVTFGSATNRPDLATWGAKMLPLRVILAAYDADQPGQDGAQALYDLAGDRVKMAPLQEGPWKDINDFYLAGGDLWEWIQPFLDMWDPIKPQLPIERGRLGLD